MNVVRLNMSHGDHKSHKEVVELAKEYNSLGKGTLAIMLDTKGPEVRSGDLTEPIELKRGDSKSLLTHVCQCPSPPARACIHQPEQDAVRDLSLMNCSSIACSLDQPLLLSPMCTLTLADVEICAPIAGDQYTFTTEEGANGTNGRISVNYDGFVNDVSVGDILLIDGGINSLKILSVEGRDVVTEVVDGGTMKSR